MKSLTLFLKKNISTKALIAIVLLFVLLLLISFYYLYNDRISSELHELSQRISYKTNIDVTKIFYDIESSLNIFRDKKDLLDGTMPVYNLELSRNDLQHFNEISKIFVEKGYRDTELNTWRNAKLRVKDKEYDVKIKIHGDAENHWSGKQKSYRVKILNDSINNIENFDLIILEDRVLTGRINRVLSKNLNLFDIRDDFIVLKINGRTEGMYYLQERIDKDFLEYNQCSNCIVIRSSDEQYENHPKCGIINDNLSCWQPYGVTYLGAHLSPFDYEIGKTYLEKTDLDQKKLFYAIYDLFQIIEQDEVSRALEYFDIGYLIRFEIFRMITAGSISGDNIFLAYKATNSKFYPLPNSEIFSYLQLSKGGFEKKISTNLMTEEKPNTPPYLREQEEGEYEVIKLFALLNRNDEFRKLKYKKVYEYIKNNEEKLLDDIHKEAKKYRPYANAHRANKLGTKTIEDRIKSYKSIVESNINLIKDVLEYSKSYINVIEKENRLKIEVLPDSIAQINFDLFKITLKEEYSGRIVLNYPEKNIIKSKIIERASNTIDVTDLIKDLSFFAGLDEELNPEKRQYDIEIAFPDIDITSIDNVEVKMKNQVTNNEIPSKDIYLQIADDNNYYKDIKDITPEEFVSKNPDWGLKGNELHLKKETYIIEEDIITPKDVTINIPQGTKILIDANKSLLSYGPVNVLGVSKNPVIIKALDDNKPFGTFGILGDSVNIDWLELSGGNEAYTNGIYFSGALSIYHSNVSIKNTKIYNNNADDGLIIKYSIVYIKDSTFTQNFADQLDLDFSQGLIKDSEFSGSRDSNGDGVDLSGSKLLIKNNKFRNLGDKGVSAGEETTAILYQNEIIDSNYAIASKDSSHTFLIGNKIEDNELALAAYRKKPLFNGGTLYMSQNIIQSNKREQEIDELSELQELSQQEAEEIINDVERDIFPKGLGG